LSKFLLTHFQQRAVDLQTKIFIARIIQIFPICGENVCDYGTSDINSSTSRSSILISKYNCHRTFIVTLEAGKHSRIVHLAHSGLDLDLDCRNSGLSRTGSAYQLSSPSAHRE